MFGITGSLVEDELRARENYISDGSDYIVQTVETIIEEETEKLNLELLIFSKLMNYDIFEYLAGGTIYNEMLAGGTNYVVSEVHLPLHDTLFDISNIDKELEISFQSPYVDMAGGYLDDLNKQVL